MHAHIPSRAPKQAYTKQKAIFKYIASATAKAAVVAVKNTS